MSENPDSNTGHESREGETEYSETSVPDTTGDTSGASLVSRRVVIGTVAAAGLGWFIWDQSTGPDDIGGTQGEEMPADVVWEREQRLREHHQESPISTTPSFDYEPVSESFNEETIPITEVRIESAEPESGDRARLLVNPNFAVTLFDVMVSLWTDLEEKPPVQGTIDGQTVEFQMYSGSDLSIGGSLRRSQANEGDELLIVRGENRATVERLAESYDEFYGS